MNVLEWYFAFHAPHRETWWGMFGHVEAFGYTRDDTWVFIDPEYQGIKVFVTHLHDEVEEQLARRFLPNSLVMRLDRWDRARLPPAIPFNCASVCAGLVGLRAYTPWGLRRSLLRNGAEIVHAGTKGRPERQGGARAPAPNGKA